MNAMGPSSEQTGRDEPTSTAVSDDYRGRFDPTWTHERLSRAGLARLGREVMLVSMLHDRSLMPHVASKGGTAASIALADDEWMAASPIYTARNRANLGIDGTTAGDALKSFQFDVGMPHHFLDMDGEVTDDRLATFWLGYCGAHDYVRWVSGNDPTIVTMMCHHMEDNTFDATLKVTNPHARAVPLHRPPKPDDASGEHCRWEIRITDDAGARVDNPNLERLRATAAAQFAIPLGIDHEPGGTATYDGEFIAGLRLEDLSHAALVRQVIEFELDIHLLMRAAYLSIEQRHGHDLLTDVARQHIDAIAPALVNRLRDALGIDGDGPDAIAKVLQINPLLPHLYVDAHVDLLPDGAVTIEIGPCEALDDRTLPSPLDQLDDDEPTVLLALARAVNPHVVIAPDADRTNRWTMRIDPTVPASEPHPLAELVGGHNYHEADLSARAVPVTLTRTNGPR